MSTNPLGQARSEGLPTTHRTGQCFLLACLITTMAGGLGAAVIPPSTTYVARETFTGYATNGLNTLGAPLSGANPANDGVNHIGWSGAWNGSTTIYSDEQVFYGASWSTFGSGPSGMPIAWIGYTGQTSGTVTRTMSSGIAPPVAGETARFWFSVWMRNAGYSGIPGETIICDAAGNTLFGIRKSTATSANVYLFGKNGAGSEVLSAGFGTDFNSFRQYLVYGEWTNSAISLYGWYAPNASDTLATYDASLTTSGNGLVMNQTIAMLKLYEPGTGQNGRNFMWDDIELLVPEPASAALLGLAGLVLLRRRMVSV